MKLRVPQIAATAHAQDGYGLAGAVADLRPSSPAITAPTKRREDGDGIQHRSALHQVHVFDLDRAAVTEINDDDRKTNGSLGSGDGQHEQREHLAREVIQRGD